MKLKQISVFLENRPGALEEPCRVLAEAGINLSTLCLADTEKFGILRLIVRDWERAARLLQDAGFVVKVTDVLAVEVPDRPGGLYEILQVFSKSGLSVEYMYAFPLRRGEKAVLIFRFHDLNRAMEALQKAQVPVVAPLELLEGNHNER